MRIVSSLAKLAPMNDLTCTPGGSADQPHGWYCTHSASVPEQACGLLFLIWPCPPSFQSRRAATLAERAPSRLGVARVGSGGAGLAGQRGLMSSWLLPRIFAHAGNLPPPWTHPAVLQGRSQTDSAVRVMRENDESKLQSVELWQTSMLSFRWRRGLRECYFSAPRDLPATPVAWSLDEASPVSLTCLRKPCPFAGSSLQQAERPADLEGAGKQSRLANSPLRSTKAQKENWLPLPLPEVFAPPRLLFWLVGEGDPPMTYPSPTNMRGTYLERLKAALRKEDRWLWRCGTVGKTASFPRGSHRSPRSRSHPPSSNVETHQSE